jgi:hypothetical protein
MWVVTGLRCGEGSKECVAIPDSKTNCNGNDGCPSKYETCNNNGKCVNTVADCKECHENGDCDADQVCKDGSCVDKCKDNSDCGKNKKCKDGKCVKRN